jgi:hypothetical protein
MAGFRAPSTRHVPHPNSGHSLRVRIARSIQFRNEPWSARWASTFSSL